MRYKCLIGLCFIVFTSSVLNAQENIYTRSKIQQTPSPTASTLGTYGGIELKKSTGGIYKNIPLFQLKEGNISYNPSIEYFSTGVKVNDWGGKLGISWNDNFTAVIQRTVRSVPDEYASQRLHLSDYDLVQLADAVYDSVKTLEEDGCLSNYYSINDYYDGEYDLFSYNIFGISGQFIIVNDKAVLLTHESNVKIDIISTYPVYTFCVTDVNGYKYFFDLEIEYSYMEGDVTISGVAGVPFMFVSGPTTNLPTAWFLHKIESPYSDILNFNYSTTTYSCVYDFKEDYLLKNGEEPGDDHTCVEEIYFAKTHTYSTHRKTTQTKNLTSVVGSDFNLQFTYISREDLEGDQLLQKITLYNSVTNDIVTNVIFKYDKYVATSPLEPLFDPETLLYGEAQKIRTRYFLKTIGIGSALTPEEQIYSFSYKNPENLPHRLSFSQDEAGYYNGIYNIGFIPKARVNEYFKVWPILKTAYPYYTGDRRSTISAQTGILNKITYPTGGNDEIIYEANSYTTTVRNKTTTTTSPDIVHNNTEETLIQTVDFQFQPTDTVSIDLIWGLYDPLTNEYIEEESETNYIEFDVYDASTGSIIPLKDFLFTPPVSYNKVRLSVDLNSRQRTLKLTNCISGITYRMRFKLYGKNTRVSYTVNYATSITNDRVDLPLPGLRVKQVTTNSLESPPMVKIFNYKAFTKDENRLVYSDATSSNISNRGNGFAYRFYSYIVVEEKGPLCGYKPPLTLPRHLKLYYHSLTSNSRFDLNVFHGNPVAYSCITEIQGNAFTAGLYDVSEDEPGRVLYGDESMLNPRTNSHWSNGLEYLRYSGHNSYGIWRIDKEQMWDYSSTLSVLPGNCYVFKKYERLDWSMFSFEPYTIIYYNLYHIWYYLNTYKETDYYQDEDSYSTISRTTNYQYNEYDKLLSGEESYNSKGEKIVKRLNRPAYMSTLTGNNTNDVYQGMVNKHFLSPVVEEIYTKNDNPVSLAKCNYFQPYPGIYVPEYLEKQTFNNPSVRKENYPDYDENGNILTVVKEDKQEKCFYWGYNSHYVVASIENMEYSEIENSTNGLKSELDKLDDYMYLSNETVKNQLKGLNESIRQKLPSNAFITTYTYDPLIGMTSQTDPNGYTTYYEYDAMGRLKCIKDNNGSILKVYEYNYAQ